MRKLVLIFSETALELVPQEIQGNPIIAQEARKRHLKPGQMLLDSNKHNLPMRALQGAEKRGRPDILHFSLLTALESLSGKKGSIAKVYVHTRANQLLDISPETRLPRIYNRFCGLMEQILSGKSTELIGVESNIDALSFYEKLIFKKYPEPSVFFFNQGGAPLTLKKFSELLEAESREDADAPIILIFGCFPYGALSDVLREYLLEKGAREIKFGDETLSVWSLVSIALDTYGLVTGL